MKYNHNQSGFIMMILLVIMVLGAAVYFANFTENRFFQYQSKEHLQKMATLEKVKNNLLLYVILHPEIYATNVDGDYLPANMVPGPGYFPCPDNNGRSTIDAPDGIMQSSCADASIITNDGFVHGFLPPIIQGRNIVFGSNRQIKQYYFVVLEKLVYQNPSFINNNRYTPLNSNFTPANLLSLNGRAEYVALLFLPGKPQTFEGFVQDQSQHGVQNFLDYKLDDAGNRIDGNVLLNNTLNREFFSKSTRGGNLGINDFVVGITLQEWRTAVYTRVANKKNLFCNYLDPSKPHWFNNHTTNPASSNWWREIMCP